MSFLHAIKSSGTKVFHYVEHYSTCLESYFSMQKRCFGKRFSQSCTMDLLWQCNSILIFSIIHFFHTSYKAPFFIAHIRVRKCTVQCDFSAPDTTVLYFRAACINCVMETGVLTLGVEIEISLVNVQISVNLAYISVCVVIIGAANS